MCGVRSDVQRLHLDVRRLRPMKSYDFSVDSAYSGGMPKVTDRLSPKEIAEARQRRLEAMNLQVIEGNPLDAEDIAMFEMFEREGWDDERCLAYIRAHAHDAAK
jgi:hypothetical protein